LEAHLHGHGFITESHSLLMVCTPASLPDSEPPVGVVIELLDETSDIDKYRAFKTIEKRSFGPGDSPEASLDEAHAYRERFGPMVKAMASLDGIPAGIGSLTYPHAGTAEAAGIATLPAFRRRGIAGAVTRALARSGFESGLESVFLTAVDEAAGRVYTYSGFSGAGTHQVNISIPG
jgi:ribosomal protein S18 acetylase RimI-like enzyme